MALDQVNVDDYEWKDDKMKLKEGDKDMTFLEHLEELRWHIIRSFLAILVVTIGLFVMYKWYFGTVLLGPTRKEFVSYHFFCKLSESLKLGKAICISPPAFKSIAVGFAEAFITAIKMSFVGGFIVASPYVIYEIWKFVKPGLYTTEQKATRGVVLICSFLFILGVLFGYYIIAPFAINFLLGFTIPGVENTPTLNSVLTYMTMFTIPAGLIFELPVVVYFLSKMGIVSDTTMRQYRKHSIIGILIVAAIVTPPDVVTQFLIAIPLYILYEISIFIAKRNTLKYQQELDE